MNLIRIQPSTGDTVEFEGELLHGLKGSDPGERTGGRWHSIAVYRMADERLAVSIEYRTSAIGESPHCMVEIAQDVSDVEAILSLYEPRDFVFLNAVMRNCGISDAVLQRYDLQVIDLLERLQTHLAANPYEDR